MKTARSCQKQQERGAPPGRTSREWPWHRQGSIFTSEGTILQHLSWWSRTRGWQQGPLKVPDVLRWWTRFRVYPGSLVRGSKRQGLRQSYNVGLRSIQATRLETGLRTGLLWVQVQHNSEKEGLSLSLKIDLPDPRTEGAPLGALRVQTVSTCWPLQDIQSSSRAGSWGRMLHLCCRYRHRFRGSSL